MRTRIAGASALLQMMVLIPIAAALFPLAAQAGTDVQTGLGGNEPTTAAVNPRSPNVIAVARGLSVAISTDFGRTFPTVANMPQGGGGVPATYGTIATWNFCGDGSVAFDSQGRLFMTYLLCGNDNTVPTPNRVDISSFVQQINPATGALVGNPVEVTGANTLNNDDKEWIGADANPDSPFRDNLYVVWSRLNTSQIMFSRSTDGGLNWSAPTAISAAGEGFVWPSHVAVAPNGDVYVTYHGDTCGAATAQMFVLRDSGGGAQLQAGTGFQKTSFAAAVSCNRRDVSASIPNAQFWMQGANQGFVIPDPIRPGNIYVVVNDDPQDNFTATTGDHADVKLARSTDNGNTWTLSTVSHAPPGTLQVFPTGASDQLGNLVITWWDTRRGFTNAAGNLLLETYATVSRDGGVSFTNDFRVSDLPFDPDLNAGCRFGPAANCGTVTGAGTASTLRIGEYNGVAAADGTGYVIWSGNQTPPNPQAVPPTASAGNQTTYFDVFTILGAFPDATEPNDAWDPGVASVLGANRTYQNQDLTIHSSTDEDWFKVTALATGQLFFTIDYNSRFADLDLQIRDKFNNPVATQTAVLDVNNTESVFIPAVAGESYFARVFPEPGQAPPLNTYDLGIVNTAAPVPFGIVLAPGSDSGSSGSDNITKNATPTIRLAVDLEPLKPLVFSADDATPTLTDDAPGYKVEVYRNGITAGRATPVAGQPGIFEFTFTSPLGEGQNFITARVVIVDNSDNAAVAGTLHAVGFGGESQTVVVTLDTTAPTGASLGPLDLLASSDSGGISDDNITTFSTPSFGLQVNEPGFIRIYATAVPAGIPIQVGQIQATTAGAWQATVQSLADGVYDMTATIEDAAGNVGPPTSALRVTIAKNSLTLPGYTVGAAGGPVTVDLAARTISGFASASPSLSIGIAGIPTVNVDVNGTTLTVNLTSGNDALSYTPFGPGSGSITLAGVNQVLNFTGSGMFTVNPLGGNDTVTTYGTSVGDTVKVEVDTTVAVQVGSALTLNMPASQIEKVGVSALQGNDTINVNIHDTVNASLFVDGGDPTTVNKGNDVLNLFDASAGKRGQYSNISGGSTSGSGAVVLNFKSAGTATRVDYVNIEKQTRK